MSKILIALDSVGIDPLGHCRPESVYSQSRFLFPQDGAGEIVEVASGDRVGVLVETDVVADQAQGAIECAITYASIFSGRSAAREHGLMRGLGLDERLLERLVREDNLFSRFENPCLANALFPIHPTFLGNSSVRDRLPQVSREEVETGWRFRGRPVVLHGPAKNGFAELFTLAEINQNIFVFAAREAGVRLRTWGDVRTGHALTSSMTHELESQFDVSAWSENALPLRTPEAAARVLAELAREHDFTFYKYQLADLVSHTGQVDAARDVFATIERFVAEVLNAVDSETTVIVTSDHGHLEQLSSSRGHPKSKVPTWFFGREPHRFAQRLKVPEGIFGVLCEEPNSRLTNEARS